MRTFGPFPPWGNHEICLRDLPSLLFSAILMLAIAAWEFIDRQRLNRPFHQLLEIIKHTDYTKAFNQLLEHLEYHKASKILSETIKHIDDQGFNRLLEIISHIDVTAAVSAAATIVIGVFSATLWWVNRRQGSDARIIQRAYVKISHSSPGVEFGHNGHFWHQAVVKNFGQTPHVLLMLS
jgi:hypothetical protein